MTIAFSSALQGIDRGFRQLEKAAGQVSRNGAQGDLASNLVDMKVAQRAIQANVIAVRAADETIGTLLDVFG